MSDPRFKTLKTDPRFRKSAQKKFKVEVDDRFKAVLDEGGVFGKDGNLNKVKIDKYGRKASKSAQSDQLKRFYRVAEDDEDNNKAEGSKKGFIDYARGEGVIGSSSEEDSDEEEDEDSETESVVEFGGSKSKGKGKARAVATMEDMDSDLEVDLDEDAPITAFPPTDDEDEEEYEGEEEELVEITTNRLAIINLDWDHITSTHLFKVFQSLLEDKEKSHGTVKAVRIYPSEFGKERLGREEMEGPPKEVFVANKEAKTQSSGKIVNFGEDGLEESEDEEEDNFEVEEDEGEEIDMDALRAYQLERLRYYYAIATFSSPEAAAYIHTECDGTEFERTANVFDIRAVGDDVEFEDEPRDEATSVPAGYKALDFVTDALRHSNVKLTWDDDAPERVALTRKPHTREEINNEDFSALIASGSDTDDGEEGASNLRDLLLGDIDMDDRRPAGGRKGGQNEVFGGGENAPEGDMEVTFTAGLSSKLVGGDENETTLEKYKRKMREKKARKKDEREEKSEEKKKDVTSKDDFFAGSDEDTSDDDEEEQNDHLRRLKKNSAKSIPTAKSSKKSQPETNIAELDLITLPTPGLQAIPDEKHFSLTDIIKAEKGDSSKKKNRIRKGKGTQQSQIEKEESKELGDGTFEINLKDERFKKINEDHRFAIDPSNPQFKKTKSMSLLLSERARQRDSQMEATPTTATAKKASGGDYHEPKLDDLVASVKRKAAASDGKEGQGKRKRSRSKKN